MTRSKRIIAIVTAAIAVLGVVWVLASRNRTETESLVLKWRYKTGKPFCVEGIVLDDKQTPAAGVHVHVEDDSGGQNTMTDDHGHFSVRIGEPEVRGIELAGIGSASWGRTGIGGLDAGRGIEFDIIIKKNRSR
jgi:hypothetical protein